jgi:hypothetical protein
MLETCLLLSFFIVSDIFIACILMYNSMTEPLILVTVSIDGIGKATATALAKGGADVILDGEK